jgi:hypothetical protein
MISILTQTGFVAAYAVCGALADYVFGPCLWKTEFLQEVWGGLLVSEKDVE